MASVEIRNLAKSFGKTEVLKDINFAIEDGEFLVLVGPSGCGKSTLLNAIAGLEPASQGDVLIDGRVVNDVHPKDRDIAMVFQSYALYPTMTVRNNITFGLRVRKMPKDEIERALAKVADLLQITALLERKPSQLSGGQRQRVAMGRALVRDPKVFLFDEPLSNLDAKLRVEMRTEIKKLQNRLGATIVYVTHDQIEAMTLATRIAIMKDGVIQQFDSPQVVYDHPANTFVAGFMGSPAMNLIPARLVSEGDSLVAVIEVTNTEMLKLEIHQPDDALRGYAGSSVTLGLRPEAFGGQNQTSGDTQAIRQFSCRVEMTELTGSDTLAILNIGGVDVTARMPARADLQTGRAGKFAVDMSKAVLFDITTGAKI